jgi:hypothetical protein
MHIVKENHICSRKSKIVVVAYGNIFLPGENTRLPGFFSKQRDIQHLRIG